MKYRLKFKTPNSKEGEKVYYLLTMVSRITHDDIISNRYYNRSDLIPNEFEVDCCSKRTVEILKKILTK